MLRVVAFEIQGKQAIEHSGAGGLGYCETCPLLGLIEGMTEVKVSPAVGNGYGEVYIDVQRPERGDVTRDFVRE